MSDENKTPEQIAAEAAAAAAANSGKTPEEITAEKAAEEAAAAKAAEDANKTPEQIAAEKKAADDKRAAEEAAKAENHDARRMKRLLREKFEAEARAEALQNVLTQYQQPQQQPVSAEPRRDQFQSDEEFINARVNFEMLRRDQQRQQEEHEREAARKRESFAQQAEKARETIDDFDDVVAVASVKLYPEVTDAMLDSPLSAQIAYELAKDGEKEAKRIATLPRHIAVKELGKIEARLEAAAKPPAPGAPAQGTRAPAPIKPPTAGAGSTAVPPDKLTDAEWNRLYGPYAVLKRKKG